MPDIDFTNLPDDEKKIEWSGLPDVSADEMVLPKQSFLDNLGIQAKRLITETLTKGPLTGIGEIAEVFGGKLGREAKKATLKAIPEGTPFLMEILKYIPHATSRSSEEVRQELGSLARILGDPVSYIGFGGAAKSVARKSVQEIAKTVKIPIFGVAHKTEDALALGARLKGNKEGIAKLKFLEKKFGDEFNVVKEAGNLDEAMVASYKKQLYREAREVAEGTGGAAEYVAKQAPLEKIAKAKPLENIEQLGQSALRKHPLMESIIKKDPTMIHVKRGFKMEEERVSDLARKLSGEEAEILDKTLNTGGAITGRQKVIAVSDNLEAIVNKSFEGKVDPKVGDVLGVRAERGRGLQNLAKDNEVLINSSDKLLKKIKVENPERYKEVMAEIEKVLGPIVGEGKIKLSPAEKLIRYSAEIGNIPRSFMTSADLSMGLRQGLWVAVSHPKIFFKAWKKQFEMFGSENYFQAIQKEIRSRSTFHKMQKGNVDFTDLDDIATREEGFMSNFAEKINLPTGPKGARFAKGIGPGRIIRASARAFTGLSNRLRADYFDYLLDSGKHIAKVDEKRFLESAGRFVNDATGRGTLPKSLEGSAVVLNTLLFSPRLLFSRLNLLANPLYYIKLHPTIRKEALKSLFKFAGTATAITGLAKMGGADVETDPRNANFMKMRVGNTRYDPLGGFQQPIRAAAQIISGKIISSTTGKEITLGEGYKPITRLGVAARFLAMKESPLVSFGHGLMEGRSAVGEKFDVPTEIANRFIPMVAQDINDLYKEKGLKGIPMAAPAIFGVGVQTYGGVQTWGLDGKDHVTLNKELLRLKTTMGFPSSSAFGYEFDNTEYQRSKKITGKKIAEGLTSLIKINEYKKLPDAQKKLLIWKYVDRIKEISNLELYPQRRKKSKIRSILRKRGVEENKLDEEVDKILKVKQ